MHFRFRANGTGGFAGFEPPIFILWIAIWFVAGRLLGEAAGWPRAGAALGPLVGLIPSAALGMRAHYGGAGAVVGWSGLLFFIVAFFPPRERLGLVAAAFCALNVVSLAVLLGLDALAASAKKTGAGDENAGDKGGG